MSNDTNIILKALSEIRTRQIVLSKFNPDTKDFYPDEYAYAVAKSVYPIYHEDSGMEDDSDIISEMLPFNLTYEVTKEMVTDVVEHLDKKWSAQELVTFYQLEGHYRNNWKGKVLRSQLMYTLRYLFLHGTFDEPFWKNILKAMEYPTEAGSILKPFNVNELVRY